MSANSRQAEYVRLNGKYLTEAEDLLSKKDFPQASEKLWGAAAEIIKAVAAKRGMELGAHRSLGDFVVRLHKENPGWDLIEAFHVANSLHTNYYEDWLPAEVVTDGARVVKDFVVRLTGLL